MRRVFKYPQYDMATWFPGHMYKGLQQMQKRIGEMDCVVEVHDARIPLTGRNPLFDRQAKMRPHILILNKVDLIEKSTLTNLKNNAEKLGASKVLFTDLKTKSRSAVYKIIDEATDVILRTKRFHREDDEDLNLLVVGIPNVGKSTLINFLRNNALGKKGKASKVGALPGITRSVLERIRVCNDPTMFLFDTPGILTPRIESADVALKLAACNTVVSHIVEPEVICDYILFNLNLQRKFKYVEKYGLSEPCDDIFQLLTSLAVGHNNFVKRRIDGQYIERPNYTFATQTMMKDFNEGRLGRLCFDKDLLSAGVEKQASKG